MYNDTLHLLKNGLYLAECFSWDEIGRKVGMTVDDKGQPWVDGEKIGPVYVVDADEYPGAKAWDSKTSIIADCCKCYLGRRSAYRIIQGRWV